MNLRRTIILAFLLSALLPAQDLLLHNGKVVTADRGMSQHEAVLIRDDRVADVGDSEALLPGALADSIPVFDLEGKMVLPGLIDSHVHALSAALSEYREKLPPLDSFEAVQEYVKARAKKTRKGEWIIVPRTFPTRLAEMRMPTKEILDVTKNHPVMFDASYVVVVNSFALELAKIGRTTSQPAVGEIVFDENGEPNGILRNGKHLLPGLDETAGFSDDEKLDALEAMLKRYLSAGLTAIGDRAVNDEQIALYRKLHEGKRLPLRVVMTWRPGIPPNFGTLLRQIKQADFFTGTGDEWLKFGPYKVTVDGGMTIGTAYQRRPYGEFGKQLYGLTNPDDLGQQFVGREKLLAIMRAAREKGWQLAGHVQGGGAIDTFLAVMEELHRERPINRERHHLIHASFQSPEAIEKAARLGILADVQSPWLYHDGDALEKVMGHEGMEYFFPLRSYIDNGIIIAGGTDHMVGFDKNSAINPYNPFPQMWYSITRSRRQGEPLYPNQSVTREEALRMHTNWAAYLQFSEEERGSIEVGKLGDLVVIDRDYFECPEEEIKEIEPVMTIVDGRVAYQR